MKILGPERYSLILDSESYSVRGPDNTTKFFKLAASHQPKLYVVSVNENPIYIGITKQPMRSRLRFGWTAKGQAGYWGYPWRNKFNEVNLDIWYHMNPEESKSMLDFETIEAEVVFIIRCAGQWPQYQTEIHFHASEPFHRQIAAKIVSRYGLPK